MLDRPECSEPAAAPKKRRTWAMRGRQRKRRAQGRAAARKFTVTGSVSNVEIVERLAEMHATADEASGFFRISQPTWNARLKAHEPLRDAWRRGQAVAAISTRRLLFQKAEQPSGDGVRAALYLARVLRLWPQDGDDGFIETARAARLPFG